MRYFWKFLEIFLYVTTLIFPEKIPRVYFHLIDHKITASIIVIITLQIHRYNTSTFHDYHCYVRYSFSSSSSLHVQLVVQLIFFLVFASPISLVISFIIKISLKCSIYDQTLCMQKKNCSCGGKSVKRRAIYEPEWNFQYCWVNGKFLLDFTAISLMISWWWVDV